MKTLFNPTQKPFSVTYDLSGDKSPETFTINALESESYDEPIYSHMKKHLMDHVINLRGINPTFPLEVDKVRKDVEVEIWTNK